MHSLEQQIFNLSISLHDENVDKEEKNVYIQNNTFTLQINREYLFSISISNNNTTTFYCGVITAAFYKSDAETSNVSIKITNLFINEINEAAFMNNIYQESGDYSNLETAASMVRYEIEPNDTYLTATATVDDDDMYGRIYPSRPDVDWYVVSFNSAGSANFWLGDIPSGCDYDFYLYASNGTTLLDSSTGTGTQEFITYNVSAYTNYYMMVKSYSGYSTLNYWLRAKNYPSQSNGDRYEPNNYISNATQINLNSIISDATIHAMTDVDYYKIYVQYYNIVNFILNNIPVGCDYDMDVYREDGLLIASSFAGSNNPESLSIELMPGYYYIKIYTVNGYSSTPYRLSVSAVSKNILNLTCTVAPNLPDRPGGVSFIRNLPDISINIYSLENTGQLLLLASGFTNSSGKFQCSINIPLSSNALIAQAITNNEYISVQNHYGNPYAEAYMFSPAGFTNLTVGFGAPQYEVAYAIWRNVTDFRSSFYSATSTNFNNKIVVRSEAGVEVGSAFNYSADEQYITLNGTSYTQDYLDKDVLFHEIGHLDMYMLNARPVYTSSNHLYECYYTNELAYVEGWANFYSCALKNISLKLNWNNDGTYSGLNVSNANYKYSSDTSWIQMPLAQSYETNQANETNTSTVMWNMLNLINFNTQRSRIIPTKNSLQALYNSHIGYIAGANNKEEAWNIYDSRGCAYDLDLPVVTSFTTDTALKRASFSADDNIKVKKAELYIDGIYYGSMSNTSSYSNFSGIFPLPSNLTGFHTLELRVYDPEGLSDMPYYGSRPRYERYKSSVINGYFNASSSALTSDSDLKAIPELMEFVLTKVNKLSTYIPSDMNKQLELDKILPFNGKITEVFEAVGYEDVYIYSHIRGALSSIKIYDPTGSLFDEIAYIAPDAPYKISNADKGTWKVEFIALNKTEITGLVNASKSSDKKSILIDDLLNDDSLSTKVALSVLSEPTPIVVDSSIYTANNNILFELLRNEYGAAVYENGNQIDINVPLSEGIHNLKIVRIINGKQSSAVDIEIIIDTMLPILSLRCDSFITEKEGIFFVIVSSDDTVCIKVNGEEQLASHISNLGVYIPLEYGKTNVTVELIDLAGNNTSETFIFERTK